MGNVDLLGKYIRFRIGKEVCYGRITSIEQNIANIRGLEQKSRSRPMYHIEIGELRVLSHDEVFKLGKFEAENNY